MEERAVNTVGRLEQALFDLFTLEERREVELRLSEEETCWIRENAPNLHLLAQTNLVYGKNWYIVSAIS